MRSRAKLASRARGLFSVACLLGAAGCEDLFGPQAEPTVYALASIAGVPVDASVDFLPICMPTLAAEGGRELRFLGDTIELYPSGRMVHRSYQRLGTGDAQAADTSRYLRIGRDVFFFREEYSGRFEGAAGGLLLREGWCGPWLYARVPATAP